MKTLEYDPITGVFNVSGDEHEQITLNGAASLSPVEYQTIPQPFLTMFHDFGSAVKNQHQEQEQPLCLNETIDSVLYDYQRTDIKKVIYQMDGRALLALGMGLGKTISSIAVTDHLKRTRDMDATTSSLLVICPSYLRHNWCRELVKWKFVAEEEEILVVMKTTDLKANDDAYLLQFPVVVISYDLIVRNFAVFAGLRWLMIIVDESAYLKNPETKRVRTLGKYLKSHSKYMLLLSGTPAMNCPRELYVQLNILYPQYFSDYYAFTIRYCNGHRDYFGWNDRGSSKERELNYVLNQLMVRRLKKDVLKDLPGKRREKVFLDIPLTKSMQKNAAKLDVLNRELSKIHAMDPDAPHWAKKFKERNVLISKMFTEVSYSKTGPVVEFLVSLVREKQHTEYPKVIIFAHHKHFLERLSLMCEKEKWEYIRIDGRTAQQSRQKLVDSFVDPESGVDIALLSIEACNTGLNFTPVTTMVFAELLFKISALQQAEDRINRIGAANVAELEYYYLVGVDTIDERILSSIDRKFNVLEKIMDNGNNVDGFNFVN